MIGDAPELCIADCKTLLDALNSLADAGWYGSLLLIYVLGFAALTVIIRNRSTYRLLGFAPLTQRFEYVAVCKIDTVNVGPSASDQ